MYLTNNQILHTFDAQTNMTWGDFISKALRHIDQPRDDVRLVYRVSGSARAMSSLTCEYDWNAALRSVKEKVMTARTRAVFIEVKNVVSNGSLINRKLTYCSWQMQGSTQRKRGKRQEKRHRDDDIPPEPAPEVKNQYNCLVELQQYLLCQVHSMKGMSTYCWVEPATDRTRGGHREMTHEEMTLWAKHMVSKMRSGAMSKNSP